MTRRLRNNRGRHPLGPPSSQLRSIPGALGLQTDGRRDGRKGGLKNCALERRPRRSFCPFISAATICRRRHPRPTRSYSWRSRDSRGWDLVLPLRYIEAFILRNPRQALSRYATPHQYPTQVRFGIPFKIPPEYDYMMPRPPENTKIKIPQVGNLTNKFSK